VRVDPLGDRGSFSRILNPISLPTATPRQRSYGPQKNKYENQLPRLLDLIFVKRKTYFSKMSYPGVIDRTEHRVWEISWRMLSVELNLSRHSLGTCERWQEMAARGLPPEPNPPSGRFNSPFFALTRAPSASQGFVFLSSGSIFDFLRYIAGSYPYRVLNRTTCRYICRSVCRSVTIP
jgi:hypothetical protein